jgi:hypothetical protein
MKDEYPYCDTNLTSIKSFSVSNTHKCIKKIIALYIAPICQNEYFQNYV